jgi:hypothetical protein
VLADILSSIDSLASLVERLVSWRGDRRLGGKLDDVIPNVLRCAECRRESDATAKGWQTYLTNDDPPEAATYCPECAGCEFGDEIL